MKPEKDLPGELGAECGQRGSSAWSLHPCGGKGMEGRSPPLMCSMPGAARELAGHSRAKRRGRGSWDTSRRVNIRNLNGKPRGRNLWFLRAREKLRQGLPVWHEECFLLMHNRGDKTGRDHWPAWCWWHLAGASALGHAVASRLYTSEVSLRRCRKG